jgi:hypothetical protein
MLAHIQKALLSLPAPVLFLLLVIVVIISVSLRAYFASIVLVSFIPRGLNCCLLLCFLRIDVVHGASAITIEQEVVIDTDATIEMLVVVFFGLHFLSAVIKH